MKLQLEFYSSWCSTAVFRINDIVADSYDFGNQDDIDRDSAEPYGCGNMKFEGKEPTIEVLEKYNINVTEYNFIKGQLEEGLSFGRCGWCI